jgi:aspartate oxidase
VTDTNGRTNIPGLFAIGECACTGVHGANRLASNSLLEGLVFADRIGSLLANGVPDVAPPEPLAGQLGLTSAHERVLIQQLMTNNVGVLRTDDSMGQALSEFANVSATNEPHTRSWETSNVLTVASLIATSARLREETRGSHWRDDFPERDDAHWLARITLQRGPDGEIVVRRRKVNQ